MRGLYGNDLAISSLLFCHMEAHMDQVHPKKGNTIQVLAKMQICRVLGEEASNHIRKPFYPLVLIAIVGHDTKSND